MCFFCTFHRLPFNLGSRLLVRGIGRGLAGLNSTWPILDGCMFPFGELERVVSESCVPFIPFDPFIPLVSDSPFGLELPLFSEWLKVPLDVYRLGL